MPQQGSRPRRLRPFPAFPTLYRGFPPFPQPCPEVRGTRRVHDRTRRSLPGRPCSRPADAVRSTTDSPANWASTFQPVAVVRSERPRAESVHIEPERDFALASGVVPPESPARPGPGGVLVLDNPGVLRGKGHRRAPARVAISVERDVMDDCRAEAGDVSGHFMQLAPTAYLPPIMP